MINSGITKIVFNGKLTKARQLKSVIKAMSNVSILAEKGGYIFSLHIDDDTIHIGILPYFIGNERSHHYDMDIPESKFKLIGFVNGDASVELFFKLNRDDYLKGLNDDEVARYRENYVRFSRFMMELNFPGHTEISVVTQDLLRELNIIPNPPKNIGELANTPTV